MTGHKVGKSAALGMAYGGSKTGRFIGGDLYDRYWHDPIRYNGRPYLCTRCEKPMVQRAVAGGDDTRCRCRHDVRQKESKQQAMERRAHWLLKREFEPDPVVIHDWQSSALVFDVDAYSAKVLEHYNRVDFAKMEERLAGTVLYGDVVTDKEKK
jgi:hypothetical protein